jgi:hypothetical protein
MELNPNHPVTRAAHDQWHKIALLLMRMMGETAVVIPAEEVAKLADTFDGGAITIKFRDDGIHLRIVGPAEAARLLREEGGQPS